MEKLKVAIIGCGTIANAAHGPGYANNPLCEILYCVDIIPERATALAEKFGGKYAITDYREAAKDSEVDIVSVCVPNYLHAPITIDFLNAGKHVLCEKPVAVNYKQAQEMKEAADRNNCMLNIGVVNRFNTAVNMVKEIITQGELGELYNVYCSFRAYRSIPGLGGPFTTKEMSGGGVLIDWGVHFLDLIMYCIAAPKINTVTASVGTLVSDMKDYAYTEMWAGPPDYNGTYDVEDFVTGMIRTDGPSITFNGAWAQNIDDSAMFIEFLGKNAGIKLQYGENFTIWSSKDGILYQTIPMYTSKDMFYDEIDAFIRCAMDGQKIRSNIDEVLITAQLLEAIYTSAAQKSEVRL